MYDTFWRMVVKVSLAGRWLRRLSTPAVHGPAHRLVCTHCVDTFV